MDKKLEIIKGYTNEEINELGFDLYHLEYVEEEGEMFLRFYIESQKGDAITLEDCEKVSRMISVVLDEKDPIEEQYFLEVSSPGLFRGLFTDEHRKEAVGQRVEARLLEDTKGKKHFRGILKEVNNEIIIIDDENKDWEIDVKTIKSLTLDPDLKEGGDQ